MGFPTDAAGTFDAGQTRGASEPQADGACGTVALVGAGPGDPALITVRGRALLERADVVLYDRLVAPALLAHARCARLIDVGKRQGNHPVPQHEICSLLVAEARRVGPCGLVVRLKGGDPYVFGRGGEEASYLREHGVPFEVVPGITSAIAAPAYAGIPVTDRRHAAAVHIITGHRQHDGSLDIDFSALVQAGGTCVFLMAVATLADVCRGLMDAGASPKAPAAVVERGTTPQQRQILGTLGTIVELARAAAVESPAVLVVGDAVSLAPELDWFDQGQLRGATVLVTRPRERAAALVEQLEMHGARVLTLPCIDTHAAPADELERHVRVIPTFDWLVLTSPFGVRCLFWGLEAAGLDARHLAGVRVAVIGPATATALRAHGITADVVPEVYDGAHLAEAVVRAVKEQRVCGEANDESPQTRVLLFRSREGAPELREALVRAGIACEEAAAYTTELAPEEPLPEVAQALKGGAVDYITFTSSSTVAGFMQAYPAMAGLDPAERPKALCLGASTCAAAEQAGFTCIVAARATMDALVSACIADWGATHVS